MTDRSPISVGIANLHAVAGPVLDALPLSDADAGRASAFLTHELRTRFLVGRWLMSTVATRTCGFAVGVGEIEVDRLGKPFLLGPAAGWYVSLAHSGELVAAAVCDVAVGIDVEELPETDLHPRMEERICSPTEIGKLSRLSGVARHHAFMRIWTRKEAYGKALGVGLDFPIRAVTAGPDGVRIGGVADRFFVSDLDVGPGYAAAVVSAGRRRVIDITIFPIEPTA